MCVVLGVGVISVFDAVAFLACVHRVSSFGAHREGGEAVSIETRATISKRIYLHAKCTAHIIINDFLL